MTLLGMLLKNRKGRDIHSAWNRPNLQGPELLIVTSEAFGQGQSIPREHAGKRVGGGNLSPDLSWSPPPPETTELVLVVEDLDVPTSMPAVHCLVLIDPSRLAPSPTARRVVGKSARRRGTDPAIHHKSGIPRTRADQGPRATSLHIPSLRLHKRSQHHP
jgi:hypothetical protein